MKKILICTMLLGMFGVSWGQDKNTEATTYLKTLSDQFIEAKANLDKENKTLEEIKIKIVANTDAQVLTDLKTHLDKTKGLQFKLDSIYTVAQTAMSFYETKEKLKSEDLKKIFPHIYQIASISNSEPKETKIYAYLDQNTILSEELFNKNTAEHKVLKKLLTEKVETYFGDITIPKDKQKLLFFYERNDSMKESNEIYYFKKIAVEIKEGSFNDIKVYVEYNGNTHIFENIKGVSMLRYATLANDNYLSYKQTIVGSEAVKVETMDELFIKLGNVMVYDYKIGNNYVPKDLTIELPQNDANSNSTNKDNPAQYQIKQETDLDKIVEFRTYSDFLALFGDSNNGLVQIEGKAKFYVFPFPMQVWKTNAQWEFLSTFSPYVNYSRFDNNTRYVALNTTKESIETTLDLVQKRYLTMGIEANLFKLKHKNFPVEANIYGVGAYQLSEINLGDEDIAKIENVKALSYGGGLHLEAKRFNHFGFEYKFEILYFDYHNYNNIKTLYLPEKLLPVVRNEAEIYYKPGISSNSAIFVRLMTYNNSSTKNNEAFYQFQFGYKFAIGNRKVN